MRILKKLKLRYAKVSFLMSWLIHFKTPDAAISVGKNQNLVISPFTSHL